MAESTSTPMSSQSLRDDFTTMLVIDVDAATTRLQSDDSQTNRRDLVRALFAAIEGMVWACKEVVIDVATSIDVLTAAETIALSERIPIVTSTGKVHEQKRFIPLTSMVRLTGQIATRISPTLQNEFDSAGWKQFQDAFAVRHRITHPKSEADLTLSSQDVVLCRTAFEWLFDLALDSMTAVLAVHRTHLADFRHLLEKLKQGDIDTLAEYMRAKVRLEARTD